MLAGFTRTLDKGDATYCFPLMAQVEQRLGRRRRSGALDTPARAPERSADARGANQNTLIYVLIRRRRAGAAKSARTQV